MTKSHGLTAQHHIDGSESAIRSGLNAGLFSLEIAYKGINCPQFQQQTKPFGNRLIEDPNSFWDGIPCFPTAEQKVSPSGSAVAPG